MPFRAICFLCFAICFHAGAQKPAQPSASDLYQSIKKLNVLGSVLYVAAHPDDENTALISYLANEKLYDITYLSLTRGDGGQNLIGTEQRELLGVLRTQELLMARSVDGGKQLFTRANDFGFSKSPEEALAIWDKEAVLADVVWAFRNTQPDVVINRFFHEKKFDTHGHHTASAMLSFDAFDKAADPSAFPEQLGLTATWQPQRLFFNTSWFLYGSKEAFEKTDKTGLFSIDVGQYLPLKGKSNSEIAAESRSMHRCQGFGSLGSRGSTLDYLQWVKGDKPTDGDIFSGINTTWSRVPGSEKVGKLLAQVEKEFDFSNPATSVPKLMEALQALKKLEDGFWKRKKMAELKDVLRGALGLYIESTAKAADASPGQPVSIHFEAIARAYPGVTLVEVKTEPKLFDTLLVANLPVNQAVIFEKSAKLPNETPNSTPYWLTSAGTTGMYSVADQSLRGLPSTPPPITTKWSLLVDGVPLEYVTPVAYKREEPAQGEIWEPFAILPPVWVGFSEPAYFITENNRKVEVKITAGRDRISGNLRLENSLGCTVDADSPLENIQFDHKGQEKTIMLALENCKKEGAGVLTAAFETDHAIYPYKLATVKYDHIPRQQVLMPATTKIAASPIQIAAHSIGYYMGAGDLVPRALQQLGCTVTLLSDKDMTPEKLATFDAIILGIRALNTKEALRFHMPLLLSYVFNGGNLLVQYNNHNGLVTDAFAPWPIQLSGARVTDETAAMQVLIPDHPAFTTPNRIVAADFEGWVQERGLYFASSWGAGAEALLSCHDPGENPSSGALLTGKYGKGHYTFTALSFFRQLPAGVPGALKLFANLLSQGRE